MLTNIRRLQQVQSLSIARFSNANKNDPTKGKKDPKIGGSMLFGGVTPKKTENRKKEIKLPEPTPLPPVEDK